MKDWLIVLLTVWLLLQQATTACKHALVLSSNRLCDLVLFTHTPIDHSSIVPAALCVCGLPSVALEFSIFPFCVLVSICFVITWGTAYLGSVFFNQ